MGEAAIKLFGGRMISKEGLSLMLDKWAEWHYYHDTSNLGYGSVSPTAKITEIGKVGILSFSTCKTKELFYPDYVEQIDQAIIQLRPVHRQVIRKQYSSRGKQHKKAGKLGLTFAYYRKLLCEAKEELRGVLSEA